MSPELRTILFLDGWEEVTFARVGQLPAMHFFAKGNSIIRERDDMGVLRYSYRKNTNNPAQVAIPSTEKALLRELGYEEAED